VAPEDTECQEDEGMVAGSSGEASRPLPVLWCQWKHALPEAVLQFGGAHDPEMAESTLPMPIVQLGRVSSVPRTLPTAEAENRAQLLYAVAHRVSFAEEPDEGNPHVRFCEGR